MSVRSNAGSSLLLFPSFSSFTRALDCSAGQLNRLLNRAEAIENRSTNLNAFAAIAAEYGIAPSHSLSRLTIKETQKVEIVA